MFLYFLPSFCNKNEKTNLASTKNTHERNQNGEKKLLNIHMSVDFPVIFITNSKSKPKHSKDFVKHSKVT